MIYDPMPILVRCRRCEIYKAIPEMTKSKDYKLGVRKLCKSCGAALRRERTGGKPREPLAAPKGFKYCPSCKQIKPRTTEFFYLQKKRTGMFLTSYCIDCHHAKGKVYRTQNSEKWAAKNRRWVEQNKEKINETAKRYRDNNRDRVRADWLRYYYAHREDRPKPTREKQREYDRRYHMKHPGKAQEKNARQYRNSPEKHRNYTRLRRTRKRNLPYNWTTADWDRCLSYWHGLCVYCGNQQGFLPGTKLTADHFIAVTDPRADNPGTVASNMIPACGSCNSSKSNRPVLEWLNEKLGPRQAKRKLQEIEQYFEWAREQQDSHD